VDAFSGFFSAAASTSTTLLETNNLNKIHRACLSALLLCVACGFATAQEVKADRILFNAEVLTMDPARPRATALAVQGKVLVAVGSNEDVMKWASPRTEVVDVGGRTIVPGLIDTHIHAIRGGQSFTFESYWYSQTSLTGALDQLKQEGLSRGPDTWVAVVGAWHPDQFSERRPPTSEDLTRALPRNPAYVQYLYDYAIVNEKGIEALGLNTGAPMPAGISVERDAQGRATGKLLGGIGPFNGMLARIDKRSEKERVQSLQKFFSELNRYGMTGVVDAAAGDYDVYGPLFALWQQKALTVRVAYRAATLAGEKEAATYRTALTFLPPRFGDDMLRFLGIGETVVIGMNDGVRMGPGFNPPQAARDELAAIATMAVQRKYPMEIHAYTDDAAKAILDVYEQVAETRPMKDLRWTIAHISSGSEQTFERMRKLGISYTVQMGPYFEAPALAAANGPEVARASPPTRLALDKGIMVAGGSDSTRIGVVNAWRAIEYHVVGLSVGGDIQRRKDYLLSREEALRLYTASAAWMTFDEGRRGSLAPGMLADLAVLDAPFLRVPADQIHAIRSVLTMTDGQVVFADRDGLIKPINSALVRERESQVVLRAVGRMHDEEERAEKGKH
jgi:predicted amidohydrolase YtcJ